MSTLNILRKLLPLLRQFDIAVMFMNDQPFMRKCLYSAIDARGFDAKLTTDNFHPDRTSPFLQQGNRL